MTEGAPALQPEPPQRWEFRIRAGESLGAILARLRGTPGDDILLDITDHEPLRTDGALRRALTAGAQDLKRRVAFSVRSAPSQPQADRPHAAKVPVTVVQERSPRGLPRFRGATVALSFPRLGSHGRRTALTFAFLAGALATAAVVFLAPRADVRIVPTVEPLSTELTVRASTAVGPDAADGTVQGELVTVAADVARVFPVSSTVQRGDRAQGSVEIVNRTETTQRVKTGSRLQAVSGVVVRTQEATTVPPRGAATVGVVADGGGTKGNLPVSGELAFLALSAEARAVLFGRVVTPLTGGTDRLVPVLTADDVRRAAEHLASQEQGSVRDGLRAKAPPRTLVRDELTRVIVENPRAREAIGSERSSFTLEGTLRGDLLAVSEETLLGRFAALALKKSEAGKTLATPLAASLVQVADVEWGDEEAAFHLRIEDVAHEAFDVANLKERLAGRTREGAAEFLRALPGVKEAAVTLSPFWIRRVPSIPRNVNVVLQLPERAR